MAYNAKVCILGTKKNICQEARYGDLRTSAESD